MLQDLEEHARLRIPKLVHMQQQSHMLLRERGGTALPPGHNPPCQGPCWRMAMMIHSMPFQSTACRLMWSLYCRPVSNVQAPGDLQNAQLTFGLVDSRKVQVVQSKTNTPRGQRQPRFEGVDGSGNGVTRRAPRFGMCHAAYHPARPNNARTRIRIVATPLCRMPCESKEKDAGSEF